MPGAIQGGLMGGGWPDVFRLCVGRGAANRFGAVWIWQNYPRALVTLAVVVICAGKNATTAVFSPLLNLSCWQALDMRRCATVWRERTAGQQNALHLHNAAFGLRWAVASGLLYAHGSGTLASTCY